MKTDNHLYASRTLVVTPDCIRTPRETIGLDDIDMISVRRPLLFVLLPPAVLLAGLSAVFWPDLYVVEAGIILGKAAVFAALAMTVGELRVHSLSLRDESVFGLIWQLRRARQSVEEAAFSKERSRPTSQRLPVPHDLPTDHL